ncbi:S1C family serine protease [Methylobacterium trifolii]|uniref:Serine protease n=1 Tax=Methylobacterium trifolii TaxID=1003092 RepID=A0ABQ4U7Z6_9HYPH|nr:serine protease [Methylobacterium trifolii]GJE62542.1 hypothetical protein MPOCJGCO_4675 [Methylobacterium trifolii]
MRSVLPSVVACILVLPASAQTYRAPEFYRAEAYFNSSSFEDRIAAQVLLIAAGYQNVVPTERFSLRTFEAINRFEADGRFSHIDGMLTKNVMDKLFDAAAPMLRMWDFRPTSHPVKGAQIWMPFGMGLRRVPSKNGISLDDPGGRLKVGYNYFENVFVEQAYQDLVEKMVRNRTTIHYKVFKEGWFVISATTSEGTDQYTRYHQDGSGILGFTLFWNTAQGEVSGERVAVLMSASLGSVMNGRPMIQPPGYDRSGAPIAQATAPVQPTTRVEPPTQFAAIPPSAAPEPKVEPKPAPVTPPAPAPKVEEEKGIKTGTGFFVTAGGKMLTNAHVIKGCSAVAVKLSDGSARKARVDATDANNDLALLTVEGITEGKFLKLRAGVRLGESAAAFGYPHTDVLASSGNFTLGNVTALAGINDDSRYYQIQVPVQSGNSGGPLLDYWGNAIGVVSSKLNVMKMASLTGDVPQNVNFALKATTALSFLETNSVQVDLGSATGEKRDPADIAEAAKQVTGFVACQ